VVSDSSKSWALRFPLDGQQCVRMRTVWKWGANVIHRPSYSQFGRFTLESAVSAAPKNVAICPREGVFHRGKRPRRPLGEGFCREKRSRTIDRPAFFPGEKSWMTVGPGLWTREKVPDDRLSDVFPRGKVLEDCRSRVVDERKSSGRSIDRHFSPGKSPGRPSVRGCGRGKKPRMIGRPTFFPPENVGLETRGTKM
jgi:hypothetical protein